MTANTDIMKTAIIIDTVGMDAGSAFVYAGGHTTNGDLNPIDGRCGRNSDGKWYFETYDSEALGLTDMNFGSVIAYAATRPAAIRKVLKMMGYNPNDFRFVYER